MEKNTSKKQQLPITLFTILFFVILVLITAFNPSGRDKRAHEKAFAACFKEFSGKSCDSVFLSQFEASSYTVEDFEHFAGRNTYIFSENATTKNDLSYIKDISEVLSKTDVTEVNRKLYICVDPQMLSKIAGGPKKLKAFTANYFARVIEAYPDIEYDFIFPYYNISKYVEDAEFEDYPVNCKTIVEGLSGFSNVCFDYPTDQPWLYDNEFIFEEGSDANIGEAESNLVFCNIFIDKNYRIDANGVIGRSASFKQTVDSYIESSKDYPDLSGFNIVIFGDSIFDMYHDNTSIQKIVENKSGADVICKAIGGMSAAEDSEAGLGFFGGELDDFTGLMMEIAEVSDVGERLVFVFEFGLNDYFRGCPVSDPEDPHNTATYTGALRTAYERIKKEYPESEFIVIAPGYITAYEGGNIQVLENGPILSDYRDAASKFAQDIDANLFDFSNECGFSDKNASRFLLNDGIHYNENGRLAIGKALIKFIYELR